MSTQQKEHKKLMEEARLHLLKTKTLIIEAQMQIMKMKASALKARIQALKNLSVIGHIEL
ncbi:hypothetical protein [Emticicia agri]|uniref:Uncharacterized protein n=1 Tax=Emticicia agri TaxID=2492393 RepID=A0A4Q5LWM5_9BACT|nr:hypothetical protein [Emticicia agri]RYU94206.1 hypothetical protein EWM59_18060 [Emticicia agri]